VTDDVVLDMGPSDADAGFSVHPSQTPRAGPWQPFQTMMTPRQPAAVARTVTPAVTPGARPPDSARNNLFLAQRTGSGAAEAVDIDPFPRSQHPSSLFAYKSADRESREPARDSARAHPMRTPMRRASALSLLAPAESARGMPRVDPTPQLYMDLPELVRLRLAWRPRYDCYMLAQLIHALPLYFML
jgi:hypothetical protein